MLRRLINPKFAAEVGLHNPPRSFFERLFRFSLYYITIVGIVYGLLRVFFSEEGLEKGSGQVGEMVGILFGGCFFYFLNYLVYAKVQRRSIRFLWTAIMLFIFIVLLVAFFK